MLRFPVERAEPDERLEFVRPPSQWPFILLVVAVGLVARGLYYLITANF